MPKIDYKTYAYMDDRRINAENKIKELEANLEEAGKLWERIKHRFTGEDIGLAKNELNKIIGNTL